MRSSKNSTVTAQNITTDLSAAASSTINYVSNIYVTTILGTGANAAVADGTGKTVSTLPYGLCMNPGQSVVFIADGYGALRQVGLSSLTSKTIFSKLSCFPVIFLM